MIVIWWYTEAVFIVIRGTWIRFVNVTPSPRKWVGVWKVVQNINHVIKIIMAKIEFTKEQEKALIRFLSKRHFDRTCQSCKHENGSLYPLSKTCESCNNHSKWKPNNFAMKYIMADIEEIKENK